MRCLSQWKRRSTIRHLRQGGIIAYPTEAVYGLGCDPLNRHAVERLLALKQRPKAKGFSMIASKFEQIEPYVDLPRLLRLERILATWPGPVTWVMPAGQWVPAWLRGEHASVAVRVTAHPLAAELCRAFGGPLVSTSANPHGRTPARTPLEVRRSFPSAPILIVHGATGQQTSVTAIYDALSGRRLR
jgi:L-threonylcarbamoyladenylate synthase